MKYVFCNYDVIGDENDYEVNNIVKFSENPIEVNEDASIDDIMNACAKKGFLNKDYLDHIDVDHSCSPNYYEFWDLGANIPFARVELVA